MNYCKCGKVISRQAKKCKPCSNRGRVVSEETKKKQSIIKLGNKNPMWRGDKVGYFSLHEWVKNRKIVPSLCEICMECPPLDLANKTGKYLRDLSDWEYICRRCHMEKDGRIKNLIIRNKRGKIC